MAFEPLNFTPIGGNSRSGIETDRNAPMGWAYASQTDTVDDVVIAGYFDTINKIVAKDQFIYAALQDNNVILTISSVDRALQQVTLATAFLQPSLPSPDDVTEIFEQSDFGEESGGKILLDDQEKFILGANVSGIILPLQNADTDTPTVNELSSSFAGLNAINYTGPAPTPSTFWTSQNMKEFSFVEQKLFDISNGAASTFTKGINTAFALNGKVVQVSASARFIRALVKNFAAVGKVENMDFFILRNSLLLNAGPLVVEDVMNCIFTEFEITSESTTTDTLVTIGGTLSTFININTGFFKAGQGESVLYIDPAIGDDSVIRISDIRNELSGNARFFQRTSTGNFVSNGWSSNDSSGSVSSVVDNGDFTITITTSAAQTLQPYQNITLSSMTVSSYDGTHRIISSTSTTVVLEVNFNGPATGSWTATSTNTTSTAHGMLDGTSITVNSSLSYNGGTKIYNVTANTFSINRAYDGGIPNQSAAWINGSIDENDKRVFVKDVEGVPDTKAIFQFAVDGWNVATGVTTIDTVIAAQNTYQNFNFSTGTPILNGTNMFTVTNSTFGRMRYEGAKAQTFMLSGFVSIKKQAAGVQNIIIAAFTGMGGTLTRETEIAQTGAVITNSFLTMSFAGAVTLDPQEEIEARIANLDGTDTMEIGSFAFIGS